MSKCVRPSARDTAGILITDPGFEPQRAHQRKRFIRVREPPPSFWGQPRLPLLSAIGCASMPADPGSFGMMKIWVVVALCAALGGCAVSKQGAVAQSCAGGPNGSAGGSTSESGTGPSTFGGNIPGDASCTGQ